MASVEHCTGSYQVAADCRYLRFAMPRQNSPEGPSSAGSIRYFAACLSRNQLKLFNIVGFDATMAACPPTCFNSQLRRVTPTFTTTSARSGRQRPSRGRARAKVAITKRTENL